MEMVLLDWTRMGSSYCLAGVVADNGGWRVVRPLPARLRGSPVSNVGWSPFLMEGHRRWEIFELMKPEPAAVKPPHVEDMWVRCLRPRRSLAPVERRRAILEATVSQPGDGLFGVPFTPARAACTLAGGGQRSLTTAIVAAGQISFSGSQRAGAREPDLRVHLPVPGLGPRQLPVKDHFLLAWAALAGTLDKQIAALNHGIRQMGDQLAVRLGLSRAFSTRDGENGVCWLMADGFFSLAEPQP